MRKSIKLVMIELAGIISRGKYTFEIRLVFPIRLLLHSFKAFEKNCHGSKPVKTIIA
jgi:hypothetical protein